MDPAGSTKFTGYPAASGSGAPLLIYLPLHSLWCRMLLLLAVFLLLSHCRYTSMFRSLGRFVWVSNWFRVSTSNRNLCTYYIVKWFNHVQWTPCGHWVVYATADEADAYVLQMFFFAFFPSATTMRQPFSGTPERIFMKLLPNDSGENRVFNVVPKWS